MKIENIIASPGRTGFFFDDQAAIKCGAVPDGATYRGATQTPGFKSIRQAGESISVMILLSDGQIAQGDCAAVQYSGAGGRDPLFLAEDFIKVLKENIWPHFIGKDLTSFRELVKELDEILVDGKPLHTAIRYGVSQALLDAVAKSQKKLMCEVIADEYQLNMTSDPVAIFSQSGDARYDNVDKMIIRESEVLPHALINHVETKLGLKGEKLKEYIKWLRNRIMENRLNEDYNPTFHIDVYGTIGTIFENDTNKMADYLAELAEIAKPFELFIEGPMDMGSREEQMKAMAALRKEIDQRKIEVKIVADEWCNTLDDIKYFADNQAGHMIQIKTPDLGSINHTVEATLYCIEKNVLSYIGGTCNETDQSARVCVHLAMAAKPDQILAKPGMGVDEGHMIVYNEMQRIIALLNVKGR